MNASPPPLTNEEQEQLRQAIEMFEVIVQASPQDCQSMEILRDAYYKLGQASEGLSISRRLADTYFALGHYSQAMIEYEGVLRRDPDNVEVTAALGEVEERMKQSGQSRSSKPAETRSVLDTKLGGPHEFSFGNGSNGAGTLMMTDHTRRGAGAEERGQGGANLTFESDGNEPLAKFLVQHRLVSEEIVASALQRVAKKNSEREPGTMGTSLIGEICQRHGVDLETLLSSAIDRAKFAFIPLEYYEVDRVVVKMLPEELTLGRLIVPFDVMSRTLMIAMVNPFDVAGKEAVQQALDYNLQWHIASPEAVAKVLRETYRLGGDKATEPMRLSS